MIANHPPHHPPIYGLLSRSICDLKPDQVPESVLKQILDDALWSPSWSNTHPYYLAIAKSETLELIKNDYLKLFDQAWPLMNGNWLKNSHF